MKSFLEDVVITALICAPLAAFAESEPSMTRAQVRADLVQVEKAGYNPSDWMHYPENIQAASARVATDKQANAGGYGSANSGSSEVGN